MVYNCVIVQIVKGILIPAAFGILLTLSLVELVTYKGVVGNYLKFDIWMWIVGFLLLLALWRSKKPSLSKWWLVTINNQFILPITTLLATITFGLESYTYTNFVFSTLRINHFVFIDVLILSFFVKLITSTKEEIKQKWPLFILAGFLLVNFFLSNYFYATFAQMSLNASGVDDDNFMEWLQVLLLVLGSFLSFWMAYVSKQKKLLMALYVGAAIIFLLLAGEEISWGQRLLTLALSNNANNYQGELNLHNQKGFNELTAFLYYLIFAYAVVSLLMRRYAQKKHWISLKNKEIWSIFTFRLNEILYLLPTFIFNPYADRTLTPLFPPVLDIYRNLGIIPDFFQTLSFLAHWRETFEVLFYAALVLHFFTIYLEFHRKPAQKNSLL